MNNPFSIPADGVIFDCDSTLSTIEGIDELAALAGVRAEVSALTDQAMNGAIPLEAVYSKRLDLIRPSREALDHIAELYLKHVVSGAAEIIADLQAQGVRVGIISGGLLPAILPLAHFLGVPPEDVFAVQLAFDERGNYQNVIAGALTTANGKKEVAANWKKIHDLQNVILIGDGMSDVAALGGADAVIGFGGVVARAAVREKASVFIEDADLRAVLPWLKGEK